MADANDNQRTISPLENNFAVFVQEMKDFKEEMKDFKEEMRNKDNQRAADMREIRNSISSMGKHVRNLSIVAMAGIAAMVVAVLLK